MTQTTPTPKDTEAAERFEIKDERSAAWYLRRLAAIEQEQDAIRAATAQRLAELDSDRSRLEHLFGGQLKAWARDEATRRRRKTVTLPLAGAQIAFRTVPARLELADRQAAGDLAVTLGMIATTPDLRAFADYAKRHFQETGELLPGVGRSEERESIAIRPLSGKASASPASESEIAP